MKNCTKLRDRIAYFIIFLISGLVYFAVYYSRTLPHPGGLSFDPYLFADLCAGLNGIVTVLLLLGFYAAKQQLRQWHAGLMASALFFSFLFVMSYFTQHYFAGETKFQGLGVLRVIYFSLLLTHIILAAISLPLVLITAYRGIAGDNKIHKKLVSFTFPIWLYVSISGVLVYFLIAPYYPR